MTPSDQFFSGLFVAEGNSDLPLSDLVEALFFEHGLSVSLSTPDFSLLGKVGKDVRSRVSAGRTLIGRPLDVVVIHRDADSVGVDARRAEIGEAVLVLPDETCHVPVIPVKMTEAWLLLDETAIRRVAGNPRGRVELDLPKRHEVESIADPKQLLRDLLLQASEATGRRRERVAKRFNQNRRQLLTDLDRAGPVSELLAWKRLDEDIATAATTLRGLAR